MRYKKEKYAIGLFIIFSIVFMIFKLYPKEKEYLIEKTAHQEVEDFDEIIFEVEDSKSEVTVFISGEVNFPQVITLEKGKRLIDGINICGGLTKDADLNRINLALVLEEEGHYIVPKIGDLTSNVDGYKEVINNNLNSKTNINTATKDELKKLPGIGDVLADRILEKRILVGKFKSIEEIKDVSGIGDKKYEEIKDKISVD